VDLVQTAAYPLEALDQITFERIDVRAPRADERQLALEVPERLAQQALAVARILGPAELLAQGRARVLGGHELAQLVERDPENVLEAQDLAQALDVGLVVGPVAPGSSPISS
jgi:hypothetical protein